MVLFDVLECRKSKMAAIKRKWVVYYVYLSSHTCSNEIPTAIRPCFRDQTTRKDYWEYCPMLWYLVYQRWRPLTGSRKDITYISARIHDSNGIPNATPMFPGSGNTDRLLEMLFYVWECRQTKMAAIYRK